MAKYFHQCCIFTSLLACILGLLEWYKHNLILNIKFYVNKVYAQNDCFKEKPSYNFIVGEFNNEIIGIAMYYIRYSSWNGEVLYLEDLIVTEKHRGKGFGSEIFKNLINLSKKYNGFCWQVLDWNKDAINFYKKFGSNFEKGWLNCSINWNN